MAELHTGEKAELQAVVMVGVDVGQVVVLVLLSLH